MVFLNQSILFNQLYSAKIMSNVQCATAINDVDKSMVCASDLANEDPCQALFGGSIIVTESGNKAGKVGFMKYVLDRIRISSGRKLNNSHEQHEYGWIYITATAHVAVQSLSDPRRPQKLHSIRK